MKSKTLSSKTKELLATISLKDSIESYSFRVRKGLDKIHKDFIQKLKDRVDNPSGEVVCSVRMIHQIIDEEAGDALIHSPVYKRSKDTPEGKSSLLDSSGTHSSGNASCANCGHDKGKHIKGFGNSYCCTDKDSKNGYVCQCQKFVLDKKEALVVQDSLKEIWDNPTDEKVWGSDNQGCPKSKGCGRDTKFWHDLENKTYWKCGEEDFLCDGCDKTDSANSKGCGKISKRCVEKRGDIICGKNWLCDGCSNQNYTNKEKSK